MCAGLVSPEALSVAYRQHLLAVSSRGLFSVCVYPAICVRVQIPLVKTGLGPMLHASFLLNHHFKAPSANTVMFQGWAQGFNV